MTSIAASSSLTHWYARRSCVLALDAPGSPMLLANFRLTPLVAVVVGLVGAVDRDADVVGLVLGQLGQLHAERIEVQARHLLVEVLGQRVHPLVEELVGRVQ